VIKNANRSSGKVLVNLARLQSNLNFLVIISKNTQIPNFSAIRPLEAKFFPEGGKTGHTDMTKLTVALRNFANAPKTCILRPN
jgi:hypothetical protein